MEIGRMLKRTVGLLGLTMLAVGLLTTTGCIRRVATITSDPPHAKVWVNNVYRGETPIEIPYNWNWYYDIRLEKPGYQRFEMRERFYARTIHKIPLDLGAEVSPVRSRESQWRHYSMVPEPEL